MDKISCQELKKLTSNCLNQVQHAELYKVRNDAKLRAVNSCRSYDEFK